MTDQTYNPAEAKRDRKNALTMQRVPEDYVSEPRGRGRHDDTPDVAIDHGKVKRDRKNALTAAPVESSAGAVRGRGRTETVPETFVPGYKSERKNSLSPAVKDPVE